MAPTGSGSRPSSGQAPPTETVPTCDLCGSESARPLLTVRDRVHGLPGTFGLVECAGCGLVRLSPRPALEYLGFYYPAESYAPYAEAAGPAHRGRALDTARDTLRAAALRHLGYVGAGESGTAGAGAVGAGAVGASPRAARVADRLVARSAALRRFGAYRSAGFPAWVDGGRALEVGSGNGAFLDVLRRHGWAVSGLDLSPDAAAAALRLYGIPVDVGQLGADPHEPASFDFVHMRHVIEHVPSPRAALERVRELLRPGGSVYVETPNVGSTGFARYGERWYPLEAPRHLWLFSPDTLTRLARESGLAVTSVRTSAYLTPRWAAAFCAGDRAGASAVETPEVSRGDLPRVLWETVTNRAQVLRNARSGDICGMWASRPVQ